MHFKRILIIILFLFCISALNVKSNVIRIDENEYYQEGVFSTIKSSSFWSAGLTPDGKLYTWGDNLYGQLGVGDTVTRTTPTEITGYFNLAANEYITLFDLGIAHMIAATSENRVFAWGWGQNRQIGDGTADSRLYPFEITSFFSLNQNENIIDVAAASTSSFALTSDGRFFSWGSNSGGILGNNSTTLVSTVTDHTSFLTLSENEYLINIDTASSSNSILAMSNQNKLYGWGSNSNGELFLGDNTSRTTNVNLTSLFSLDVGETITAYNSGSGFSNVATSNGDFYVAGKNSNGELGDGTTVSKNTPVNIASSLSLGIGEYVSVADSNAHTLLSTNLNRVFAWGYQPGGQINGTMWGAVYTPLELTQHFILEQDESIESFGAGYGSSYAVSDGGHYWAWGTNNYGLLSFDYPFSMASVPIKGPDYFDTLIIKDYLGTGIAKLSTDYNHTIALNDNGNVVVWGQNSYGQLGIGNTIDKFIPIVINDYLGLNIGESINDIGTGLSHSVFLTSTHRVLTVGRNNLGQLGTGNTTNASTVVDITQSLPLDSLDYVVSLHVGGNQTFLLTHDNKVIAFGDNSQGQLGVGNNSNQYSPIDITSYLGLNLNETVLDIINGYAFTLIQTSDERLLGFGDNTYGQLGNNTWDDSNIPVEVQIANCFDINVADIIDIQSGEQFTLLLTDDNDVCVWGRNINGTLGEGGASDRNLPFQISNQFPLSTNETFDKIAVGIKHSFMITSEGDIYAWGEGYGGKLGTDDITDKLFPFDVTSQMDVGSDTIDYFVLGRYTSFLITTQGNTFGFGRNDNGELAHEEGLVLYDPTIISKGIEFLKELRYSTVNEIHYVTDEYISIKLYFEYNIYEELLNIRINGITYTKTFMEEEFGEIIINIPNTYSLNDVAVFTIQTINLYSGSATPTGPVYLETLIEEDTEAPTFDVILDQEIEVGSSDIDWTTYITNLQDNSNGDITLSELDSVNYSVVGTYNVSVTATDEALNEFTRTFDVLVIDSTLPIIEYSGPQTFEVGSEPYDFLDDVIATDNYDGEITLNIDLDNPVNFNIADNYVITFTVTDSNDNTASLEVDIHIVDTIYPTFDFIENQMIEVGTVQYIDWTDYILNASDNSNGTLLMGFTDNINYSYPDLYSVTVWVEDPSENRTEQTFSVQMVDTTPPNIYMYSEIYTNVNEVPNYLDYFYAFDGVDGDVSGTIIVDDSLVDYSTPGIYHVNVDAFDSYNNMGSLVADVYVIDVVAPSFDIIPDQTFEVGTVTSFNWTTLVENLVDDVTLDILLTIEYDDVDFDTLGDYIVVIRATDESLNYFERNIFVYIVDTSNPIISFIEDQTITVEIDNMDWESLVIVTNEQLEDIEIEIIDGVSYQVIGSYVVNIIVTDSSLNQSEVIFNVHVIDDASPVIEYTGDMVLIIEAGTVFVYPEATCTDNYDQECVVLLSGTVATSVIANYTLILSATDTSDNSDDLVITVSVVDTTPPTVELITSIDTIYVGDDYNIPSVLVDDIQYFEIDISGVVNPGSVGNYEITYTVTDPSGNSTIIKRIVNVIEAKPEIHFNIGNSLTTLKVGEVYVPGSCTATVDGVSHSCDIDVSDINNTNDGVYEVVYSVVNGTETYEYIVYVHYVNELVIIIYYYKEEELEVLL